MNTLKHLPKISKRDVYGSSVVKYFVLDEFGFNSGEFNNKIDAITKQFQLPGSKIFKIVIYELLK